MEWNAVGGYARGIDQVLDEVQALIEAGFPEAAIEAAEHALAVFVRSAAYHAHA